MTRAIPPSDISAIQSILYKMIPGRSANPTSKSATQVADASSLFDDGELNPENAIAYLMKRQPGISVGTPFPDSTDGIPLIQVPFTYNHDGSKGAASIWQEPEGLYGEW